MTIDNVFTGNVLTVYPEGTDPHLLRHNFSSFRPSNPSIPFDDIHEMLANLRSDVEGWYERETGVIMDTYQLGDKFSVVQEKFWSDDRFKEALSLLGLSQYDYTTVKIPWWNEIAANETGHRITDSGIEVDISPRHSYETQMARAGVELPVQSVSVGGIVIAKGDVESPEGYLVMGLRGGATLSNTYHVNAGALGLTPEVKNGSHSIYDFFLKHELDPEFGIDHSQMESAVVYSRTLDRSIEKGPMYNFLVRTALTPEEVHSVWEGNSSEDKKEHQELLFIPNNPQAIQRFVRENYVGICANRPRGDHERHLLHPSALIFAGLSGMPIDELKSLYVEGMH